MDFRKAKQQYANDAISVEEIRQAQTMADKPFEKKAIYERSVENRTKGSLVELLEAAKEKRERTHHAPTPRKISPRTTIVVLPSEQPEHG